MKYLLFLVIAFAILSTAAFSQMRYDVTMTVDSVERQFIVVRPSGAVPPGGYAIVMMFHGTSGDGEKFYNISGWREKGEAEKFLTVFPSSLEYCFLNDSGKPVRTTKWNNGEAQEKKCPGENLKDDVRFVRQMLDSILEVFPIDRRRIYASGFSNGGVFVSKLAVEMSDLLAAVGAAAGSLNSLDSAAPQRNIPVASIIGNMDHNLIERTGLPFIPLNDTALLYFTPTIRSYLGAFSLTEDYTEYRTPLTLTYRFNTPASSAPSTEYSFTLIDTLAHEYPNGRNHPVVAANEFWRFFNRFTLPSSVNEAEASQEAMTIYPNPASTYIMIDGEGEMTLTLHTMLGQQVYMATAMKGTRIDLPGLAAGMYIAEVSGARTHSVKMLLLQ